MISRATALRPEVVASRIAFAKALGPVEYWRRCAEVERLIETRNAPRSSSVVAAILSEAA